MESVYDLYRSGMALLEAGDHHAAAVALGARATWRRRRRRSARGSGGPSSIPRRYEEARTEFEAVVEHAPTNDYALFCLGRSLQQSAATPRRAAPWRSPRACARNARTTSCTASAPLWRRHEPPDSQQPARRIVSRA